MTLGTITIPVGPIGVTVKPTVGLNAAGASTFIMPNFKLQLGMSASVNVKLGGKVTFNGITSSGATSPIFTGYSTFTATYTVLPFKLSGFDSASGAIDVTLVPSVHLLLWGFLGF